MTKLGLWKCKQVDLLPDWAPQPQLHQFSHASSSHASLEIHHQNWLSIPIASEEFQPAHLTFNTPDKSWTMRQKWSGFVFLSWGLVVWVRRRKPTNGVKKKKSCNEPLNTNKYGAKWVYCYRVGWLSGEEGPPVTLCDLSIRVQVNGHIHLNTFQEDTWQKLALVCDSWQCWAVMQDDSILEEA